MTSGTLLRACLSAALLAGCVDDGSMAGGSDVPLSDVEVCEAAVTRETGNRQVRSLRTEVSEADTAVVVGVGPNAAPWQCLVNDGIMAGVLSLTNEGSI
jgi:hypothetical protein